MSESRSNFQRLLRDLFQFDCADLDFGIYRILNFKRDAIEKFIEKDLLDGVATALKNSYQDELNYAAADMEDLAERIRDGLAEDAIDGDGNLAAEHQKTRLGRKYLARQRQLRGAAPGPGVEAAVFNHLYAFFNRYYDAGDFISKRKYSERRNHYAVPYNGEEVYLHWANKDQYYVKTGEHFTNYRCTAHNGVAAHFHLRAASVEHNNVKGDKRFFLPLLDGVGYDTNSRVVTIPFEFRPLRDSEEKTYGARGQQEAIIDEAVEKIPDRLSPKDHGDALGALLAEHHRAADGSAVTFLAHHLRHYTRRNTSDFFVHKNLKGFLTQELDFYLKNEVLNLDEMETGLEARSEGWFQIMRAIRAVGGKIIDFLAQIEDFQKMLFEKRKFITDTQYCITVRNVPEGFHGEIAACDPQWDEWKELFHIDEEQKNLFNSGAKNRKERRLAFLKDHPTLVLDTT
ncbi:MAG: site-specific DNA-methyltransferase, partial [Planctomycetes bacterium]|nr:site-specific DNA-methyltransferase [Planctomycetota bacterium]